MNTNQILKCMIKKVWKNNRQSFINKLHVDIEKCEPINVKEQKYIKEQQDNLFFFLDKEFKIIMVLKGSKYQREWNQYGDYPYNTPWNRKNMEPLATYVLMITPKMKKEYKPNKIINHRRKNTANENLQARLKEYKNNKNQIYSHDKMKEMITEIMCFLIANIFQDKEYAHTYFGKLTFYNRTMPMVISDFSGVVNQYLYNYETYIKEREKYGDEMHWFSNSESEYLKYKNQILDWNKIIENIKNQQEII